MSESVNFPKMCCWEETNEETFHPLRLKCHRLVIWFLSSPRDAKALDEAYWILSALLRGLKGPLVPPLKEQEFRALDLCGNHIKVLGMEFLDLILYIFCLILFYYLFSC